jgi:hypothetical protein
MLCIAPPSARRQLCHLIRLQREGEALLEHPELCYVDECRWEARVWKCLDKVAGRRAFQSASQVDREEVGPIDLLAFRTPRPEGETDRLVRRRIQHRLVNLASVIEKVEALAETLPRQKH